MGEVGCCQLLHFPISAVDTTNRRNGRTSKTYLWARNMDTLPRKLNPQSLPFGKPLTFVDGMASAVHRTGPGLEAGVCSIVTGLGMLYGTDTSSAPWQHPDL